LTTSLTNLKNSFDEKCEDFVFGCHSANNALISLVTVVEAIKAIGAVVEVVVEAA
jgi:hypothetical protein